MNILARTKRLRKPKSHEYSLDIYRPIVPADNTLISRHKDHRNIRQLLTNNSKMLVKSTYDL